MIGTLDEFIEGFALEDPCLIVARDSAKVLIRIQQRWEDHPCWTSKTAKRERTHYDPKLAERGIKWAIEQIVPLSCGWKVPDNNHRDWVGSFRRISYFLDPDLFYGWTKTVADIFGTAETISLTQLIRWAQAVDEFRRENDLPPKQTQGALGAQFLTDRRFYPEPRRKVSKATNDRLRRYLPGNHSICAIDPGRGTRFTGIYLDQRRAHHYHAAATPLPNSNSLFAFGDFARLRNLSLNPDAFLGGDFHGVVCGNFAAPKRGVAFMPPRWRRRSVSRRMVTTAEWPWLADIGVSCTGLYAAWGSAEVDTGIPAYARYASSQLDLWSTREMGTEWLKPILVSTYGSLAVNTDQAVEAMIGGIPPEGRTKEEWPVGTQALHGYLLHQTKGNKVEPGTVNVLHRMMIEAATRTESLAFANHLDKQGHWVLMVHVDAVIVEESDRPIPLFDPWRVKSHLTDLVFHDDNSFESTEMIRMPGRPIRSREMVSVRPPRPFRFESGLLEPVPEPA